MFSIIKPRGDIKSNWESVNPVLRLREWGVEWKDTIGVGETKLKIGDGITHWNDLDYAITNDITKKVVKTFATIPENQENPILLPGASLETLFGQVKRKFDYTINFMSTLKNMVGDYQTKSFHTGSGTVTASDLKSAIDILEQYKLTTANILDVNDSTNTLAALSANQGRLISEKVDANAEAIGVLNSNLSYKKIDSKLNFPDSRIAGTAYIENNFIVLNVIIKASSPSGELLSFYITDEKYIPRIPVCGTYAAHMSGLDAGKFNSALINSSGKGDIYLNEQMTYGELVTFVYPCRSKSDSFADI